MTQLFANNARATLASLANASATSLSLDSGQGALFPSPSGGDFFKVTLTQACSETSWEVVKVTSRSGDVLTVERGQEGTSAATWPIGSKAELRLTAGVQWPPASVDDQSLVVQHTQPSGTAGGATSAGNNALPYNSVVYNTVPGASLSGNAVANLPAGRYTFRVSQAVGGTGAGCQLSLVNLTANTVLATCESTVMRSGVTAIVGALHGQGSFELASSASVGAVLWVASGATNGLGIAVSSGLGEVFGTLSLRKVS